MRKKARTELHVREEAKRALLGAALHEADDVDPELHVVRRRARVRVHEEGHQDTRVCGKAP